MRKRAKNVYQESIFMDSGAYSLYNYHVRKITADRMGAHGRVLETPKVRRGQGDFSYYDLTKGSDFRKYCDRYAGFIRKFQKLGVLVTNVDVISNPDLTWEVQRFFEEEHGVVPVPVVHCGTSMKYVERYLAKGIYDLLGVGGLGQNVALSTYFNWADQLFALLCPASNQHLPVIKTHGFAMTSWKMICRWPWWSVDSATWVKLAAYGWLYFPLWTEGVGWRYDRPPVQINFSWRSPYLRKHNKHVDNLRHEMRETVERWLEKVGVKMGSVDKKGNVVEFGVRSHFKARAIADLHYLKDLEESRPPWPHPLDNKLIELSTVRASAGFGF